MERRAAFNRLFDANWAQVREHVECVTDDDAETSEIVSEVFTLAWQKLDVRRPMSLAWLIRVADNKLKDRERARRARSRAVDALSRDLVRAAPDLLDGLAVRHAVDVALTSRERRIVVLFYWDRLSAGEIATVMRCTQASVFTALSRARAKLGVHLRSDEQVPTRQVTVTPRQDEPVLSA